MKILQINATYGFGSTGVITQDIGEAIENSGHEAFFAYQRTNQPLTNGYQIGNVLDWKTHAMLCRLLGRQGFYSKQATKRFLSRIDKLKPDAVHLHNLHSNYIHTELLFRYLAEQDIATVVTMHDCWYFTGKCFHYIDCGCQKFTNGCGDCIKRTTPPCSLFFDTSAKDYETKKKGLLSIPRLTIVGCSQWICDEARKSFLSASRIEQIYNGVDTHVFCPQDTSGLRSKYGIAESDYVVLGMANKWMTKENKGIIPMLLRIPEVKLMILGCSEHQKLELRQYGSRVLPIGYISDRRELSKHYNLANIFLNLTYADTLPTVNMESICCGTPVISFDAGGSPELIEKETGMVVKTGDFEGIIKAIDTARQHCWAGCASAGAMKFDKTVSCNRYINLYQDIIS